MSSAFKKRKDTDGEDDEPPAEIETKDVDANLESMGFGSGTDHYKLAWDVLEVSPVAL